MTIPNLNSPANNTNQASCLDLILASQLVVEPVCSWRSEGNPQLEVKVSSDGESVRYSVYNHHPSFQCYWPNSASSSNLTSVFAHCVWKDTEGEIESRLFGVERRAILVSIDPQTKKIGIKQWVGNYSKDFLIKNNPIISAINDDNSLEFQEEVRKTPRSRPYDPEAEEGMTRCCRTEEGQLVMFKGEPSSEKTVKVWPGPRDIRLIKLIEGRRKEILCRVFSWENKKNSVIPHRFAPDSEPNLSKHDDIIQHMTDNTPEFENAENKEVITFYREHPLNCFMSECVDLSMAEVLQVQRWVYEQFYRKEGENKERFEYTNFVSAKKTTFSFGKGKKENILKSTPKVEAWHVEMKRQAGLVLQFPIGISNFFSGIFLAPAQNPAIVDEKAMERLVQGVPLLDLERNKIVDDFAMELGACSIINFYIACDRSSSQLEINGRTWVRTFAGAGKGIRGAVVRGGEGLGRFFNGGDVERINRGVGNAAAFVNNLRIIGEGLQALFGAPPAQNNPENEQNV